MAIMLGEVGDRPTSVVQAQAQARERERVDRPSIREVRLVGIEGVRPAVEGAPVSGRHVLRSGRAYRVESTQVRAGDGGGPLCYVHLSALTEC